MGSHSVACHPTEVTFPPLPQPKLVLDLATPEGCKAELTCDLAVFLLMMLNSVCLYFFLPSLPTCFLFFSKLLLETAVQNA